MEVCDEGNTNDDLGCGCRGDRPADRTQCAGPAVIGHPG